LITTNRKIYILARSINNNIPHTNKNIYKKGEKTQQKGKKNDTDD
jgi:hypothetical protein